MMICGRVDPGIIQQGKAGFNLSVPSSVSDFVLHAAKQNGSAILEGIIRCWYFPVFSSALSAV